MIKEESMVTREKVTVVPNSRDGVLEVMVHEENAVMVTLQQVEWDMAKSMKTVKRSYVVGDPDDVVEFMRAGLPGHIVIEDTVTPPDPEEPEKYLLWLQDNKVARTDQGQPVYRISRYTEKDSDEDHILYNDNIGEWQ